MNRKFLALSMGVVLVVVIGAVGYYVYKYFNPTFHGSLINPSEPAYNFSLTSQAGTNVQLSEYRGKYVLVYFGFTNCTSECPLTMGYLKQMHDKLGTNAARVQVIMISTDPARDTPAAMGTFLGHFDPSFIGLTGTKQDLQPVWAAYGVSVLDNGETHSSYLYLIDPSGNLMATYPVLQNSTDITADIQALLRKQ